MVSDSSLEWKGDRRNFAFGREWEVTRIKNIASLIFKNRRFREKNRAERIRRPFTDEKTSHSSM